MTHYETLGVEKDASPNEIKKAYRKRATETHPDKGGKPEDFEPIARAYKVLSDPGRRLLYDATGADERPPIEAAVQTLLVQLINKALGAENDVPIIEGARAQIRVGLDKIPKAIDELKTQAKKLKAKRKRVTSSGPKNLVHMIIDDGLKSIEGQSANLEHETKVGKEALKALETYTEDLGPPKAVQFDGWTLIDSRTLRMDYR